MSERLLAQLCARYAPRRKPPKKKASKKKPPKKKASKKKAPKKKAPKKKAPKKKAVDPKLVQRILSTYDRLARRGEGDMVTLTALRSAVPVSRARLDAALATLPQMRFPGRR